MKRGNTLIRKVFVAGVAVFLLNTSIFAQNKVRPVEVKVDFGEKVTKLEANSIIIGGGIITGEIEDKGNGLFKFFVEVPAIEGEIEITVLENAVKDLAGNGSVKRNHIKKYDRVSPTPLITSSVSKFSGKETVNVLVDFKEAVKNFSAEDLTISSGTLSNFVDLGDGKFSFDLSQMSKEDVVISIAEGVCTDKSENQNLAGEFTLKYESWSIASILSSKKETKSATVETSATNVEIAVSTMNVNVYPNPSDGKFLLNYSASESIGKTTVRIFDINGRELFVDNFTTENSSFNRNFDISKYSKGVYMVQVQTAKGTETKRVIVEK